MFSFTPITFRSNIFILSCLLLAPIGCSSQQYETRRVARFPTSSTGDGWKPSDLAMGPVGMIKGVVSIPLCPLRLTSESINSLSSTTSGNGAKTMEIVTLPVRAVVDGVVTGAAYIVTGVIDTVSGGTIGATEGVSRQDEPNSEISCVIAGKSGEE